MSEFLSFVIANLPRTNYYPAGFADQAADDSKTSAEAAASAPATPSKYTDDSTVTRVKRSISELEEPTVQAKFLKA